MHLSGVGSDISKASSSSISAVDSGGSDQRIALCIGTAHITCIFGFRMKVLIKGLQGVFARGLALARGGHTEQGRDRTACRRH